MRKKKKVITAPDISVLEAELKREKYRLRYWKVLRSTIYTLIVVAAIAALVATLWMPVLRIYGSSMTPTLEEGDVVVSVKAKEFEQGDIIAFYYNNKILVKRVIGNPGDWIDISEAGDVYVNGERIDEPYLQDKALGECDIEMPYQVPESRVFVMGDHRSTSVDSRSSTVGCIAEEQIVGKLMVCIWPFESFAVFE